MGITALVPTMAVASVAIMLPTAAALVLVARFGRETKGRDLRDLDEAFDAAV